MAISMITPVSLTIDLNVSKIEMLIIESKHPLVA